MGHHLERETSGDGGRGATVLTLGILSIVLAGCAPAGLILGYLAFTKAKEDLPRFDRGEFPPQDRGMTQAGHICGIEGMCFSALTLLVYLFQLLFFVVAIALGGP